MALNTFGVTPASVRAHHFPQLQDFNAFSSPTAATVATMVEEAAGTLAGRLRAKGISPAALTQGATPEGWAWCAQTVRLMAAVSAVRAMTGQDPEVARALASQVRDRLDTLEEEGPLALGDAPQADGQPSNGPRSHVTRFNLDTGSEADVSDVVPRFRRSDAL